MKIIGRRAPNGNVDGDLETEWKYKSKDISLEGKFSTSKKYEATLNFSDYLEKGTKFFLRGKYDKDPLIEGGFDFKNESIALNEKITVPPNDPSNATGYSALVLNNSNISIGGDAELTYKNFISKWSFKVKHDKDDRTFCFFSNHETVPKKVDDIPKSDVGFGYFQKIRTDLTGALDFKVDSNMDSVLRFGCNYAIDDQSNVKTRLSLLNKEEMRLGLVYKQNLTNYSKIAVSSDLNIRKLIGNDRHNDHKFWLSLTFGDD